MRVLSLIAALSLIASPALADNIRDNNLNLQGQQQGQAQGQGQLSINENDTRVNSSNRNNNANINGNSNRNSNRATSGSSSTGVGVGVSESNSGALSGSESGAASSSGSYSEGGDSSANGGDSNATSGSYSDGSNAGATSEGINGVSNTTSFNDDGDDFTTIVLPDPVDISLPQNTQPGLTAQCRYFGVHSDYVNGRSSGVSLYVFGFSSSRTPSDVHETGVEGLESALVCGLSDQVIDQLTGENSLLSTAEKAALQRMAADELMHQIYRVNGKEYKPRYLDLESINRTPIPTIESLN